MLLILISLEKCSTAASFKDWSRKDKPVVYSGVRSCWSGIPGGQGPVAGPAALFGALYCLIDTPFSSVLDTLLLPVSLPFSALKYLYYKDDIYIAVKENNAAEVRYCIRQGANLNSEDFSGRTVLDYAFEKCILHRQGSSENTPHKYAGNRQIAELLFAGGARKTSSKAGNTALHFAAYCGYTDMAASLLQEGFRYDQKNKEGLSPMDIAEKENQKAVSDLFRKTVRQ